MENKIKKTLRFSLFLIGIQMSSTLIYHAPFRAFHAAVTNNDLTKMGELIQEKQLIELPKKIIAQWNQNTQIKTRTWQEIVHLNQDGKIKSKDNSPICREIISKLFIMEVETIRAANNTALDNHYWLIHEFKETKLRNPNASSGPQFPHLKNLTLLLNDIDPNVKNSALRKQYRLKNLDIIEMGCKVEQGVDLLTHTRDRLRYEKTKKRIGLFKWAQKSLIENEKFLKDKIFHSCNGLFTKDLEDISFKNREIKTNFEEFMNKASFSYFHPNEKFFDNLFSYFPKLKNKHSTVHDVGAGTGFLTEKLRDKGIKAEGYEQLFPWSDELFITNMKRGDLEKIALFLKEAGPDDILLLSWPPAIGHDFLHKNESPLALNSLQNFSGNFFIYIGSDPGDISLCRSESDFQGSCGTYSFFKELQAKWDLIQEFSSIGHESLTTVENLTLESSIIQFFKKKEQGTSPSLIEKKDPKSDQLSDLKSPSMAEH